VTPHNVDSAIITTAGQNAGKTSALRDTVAKSVIETTFPTAMMNPLQKPEVRSIKSLQTAEVLLPMKAQTPINISLLTELLRP